ncbi:MAG: cob(I)yrinic acid a,c-diamide adenosyltransferase [Candidatus Izimaplasma sp.]|nr:cob(I)yrinic acid a,c-diamide adenosyltransferase [Candidatus Izimaplasma bacterium]
MNLNKVNQISTKAGDQGKSKNYSNESFFKSDYLFEAMGTIDELSSFLGLSYHYVELENRQAITTIQQTLQNIMSLIASTKKEQFAQLTQISEKDIADLERIEQSLLDKNPLSRGFVLPGSSGTKAAAYLDVSRALARRAERRIVAYVNHTSRDNLDNIMKYINRLSDLLFIMARNS